MLFLCWKFKFFLQKWGLGTFEWMIVASLLHFSGKLTYQCTNAKIFLSPFKKSTLQSKLFQKANFVFEHLFFRLKLIDSLKRILKGYFFIVSDFFTFWHHLLRCYTKNTSIIVELLDFWYKAWQQTVHAWLYVLQITQWKCARNKLSKGTSNETKRSSLLSKKTEDIKILLYILSL